MRKLFGDTGYLLLAFFTVAFFGGAAKSMVYRKPNWKWFDTLAAAFASGFTGFVVGSLCLQKMGVDYLNVIMAISGLAGWLGPSLMDYMAGIGMTFAKSKFSEQTKDEQKPVHDQKDDLQIT